MSKIEISRSYSRKVNNGNYETSDFFCSVKKEVDVKDLKEAAEEMLKFCKTVVEIDAEAHRALNRVKANSGRKEEFNPEDFAK